MRVLEGHLSIALLVACLAASCGGGSGGTCPNLAGTWSLTSEDDNTKCGESFSTNTRQAVVTQNGCSFTLTSSQEVVNGTLNSTQITGTSTSTSSGGVTTGTFDGTLSQDGNRADVTSAWTYKGSVLTCNGTSQITATRLSSAVDGGTPVPSGTGGSIGAGGVISAGGVTGAGGQIGRWDGSADGALDGNDGALLQSDAASDLPHTDASTSACSLVGFYAAANANHVIVNGNYAYVAEGSSGIEILDIANPAAPTSVGSLPTTNAYRLALRGTDLYLADGNGGLKVIDVSNPASPQLVATPTLLGSGSGALQTLVLGDSTLYAGYLNLNVFDISTPAAPVAKGSLSTTFVEDMALDGNLIYGATAEGLKVFSVLSPTGPFLAGSSSTSTEWGQAVVLAPGYAFYGSSSGLTVFDVSTPSTPAVAGSSGVVKSVSGLTLQGSTLYVSGSGPGLSMMDVSNPRAPKLIGKCGETAVASPKSMTIAGPYGFVAGGSGGVVILKIPAAFSVDAGAGGTGDASVPSSVDGGAGIDGGGLPTASCGLVGFYPAAGASHVIVSDTHAYVAEGSSGIEVLDISNPASPSSVGSLPTTNASRLALRGTDLYVADGSGGLKVIDVSNPANPQLVATPTLPGYGSSEIQTLALSGNGLYAAYIGLDVFDITSPAAPVAKGSVNATFIQDLAVDGTLVYAATADGLDVFSVLSFASPFLAGSLSISDWGHAVALSPGYAFYGAQGGLTVLDVSTPSAPSVAGSSGEVTSINGLTVHNSYLYVSGNGPGLAIVDISNPKVPKVAGKCGEMAVGTPKSMTVSGSYGFVAGGTGGVFILSLPI